MATQPTPGIPTDVPIDVPPPEPRDPIPPEPTDPIPPDPGKPEVGAKAPVPRR